MSRHQTTTLLSAPGNFLLSKSSPLINPSVYPIDPSLTSISHRTHSSNTPTKTASTPTSVIAAGSPETASTSPDNVIVVLNKKPTSPSIPEIVLTPPDNDTDEDEQTDPVSPTRTVEPSSRIPTQSSLPTFEHAYDYASTNLTGEDLANLDFITTLSDPITGNQYAQLTCGYWYWAEDEDNVRQMVEQEYGNFLDWIDAVNRDPSNFNTNISHITISSKCQPIIDPSQQLTPYWTPRAKD